jgi:menaquinone-9 beta-reductase
MHGDICMIGDAAGLITPLCGDGVSMALDGGERASEFVSSFLASELGAQDLRHEYRRRWKQEFANRMTLGRVLQRAFLRDVVTRYGVRAMRTVPTVTKWMIRATRG